MSSRHPELAHYIGIQAILTGYLSEGYNPTSQELQQRHFGIEYDKDSRYQYQVVYDAIQRGRELAVRKWWEYVDDQAYIEHINKIVDQEPERIEKELNTDDYLEFKEIVESHKNVNETQLEKYPVVALVFEDKIKQYSRQKLNLVISTYGINSRWYRPSFWAWNIRENGLIKRSAYTLEAQLIRAWKAKVELLTGSETIEKAIGYNKNIIAAIEDGTSWKCPHCNASNIESMESCTICGTIRGGF